MVGRLLGGVGFGEVRDGISKGGVGMGWGWNGME